MLFRTISRMCILHMCLLNCNNAHREWNNRKNCVFIFAVQTKTVEIDPSRLVELIFFSECRTFFPLLFAFEHSHGHRNDSVKWNNKKRNSILEYQVITLTSLGFVRISKIRNVFFSHSLTNSHSKCTSHGNISCTNSNVSIDTNDKIFFCSKNKLCIILSNDWNCCFWFDWILRNSPESTVFSICLLLTFLTVAFQKSNLFHCNST